MVNVVFQLGAIDATTQWLLVVAVGLTIFYAVMRPLRKKKDPLSRPGGAGLSLQRSVERDMNNLLVELSEMTRQVTAQLDTRTLKLELLLKEADQRIATLEQALKQSPPEPASPAPHAPLSTPTEPPAPPPKVDPRHSEVYTLADQALSTQEISSRLSRPRGEIELILALRHRG